MTDVQRRGVVQPEIAGQRLDRVLVMMFPENTRSRLQQWITAGKVKINGVLAKRRDKVNAGDVIELCDSPDIFAIDSPEYIPLEVIYEDEALLVVNKPPGLVVHPGSGNPAGTLVNALLYHLPGSAALPRAGIVHRLDKDTSGLLVVAKTEPVRQALIAQLQHRTMGRKYVAIVHGVLISGGTIDAPVGRHRSDRKRMAVTSAGKDAVSHYRVLEKYRRHTLVSVSLESGRTHQIRVHMAHLGFPVLGDPVYGGRMRVHGGSNEKLSSLLSQFRRQALHAIELQLVHPLSEAPIQWAAPIPDDMSAIMKALQEKDD